MKLFNSDKHLTEEAIALYVEALKMEQLEKLPAPLLEHMEECTECHQQAIELYALIADMDYSQLGSHPTFEKTPIIKKKPYLRTLFVAMAAGFALLLYIFPKQELAVAEKKEETPLVTQDSMVIDTTSNLPQAVEEKTIPQKPKREERPVIEEEPSPELIAANFEVSEELEGLVDALVRNNSLKIEKPEPEASVKVGQIVSFAWQNSQQNTLFLIILDNQENELLRTSIDNSPHEFKADIPKGLYYWKLESEEDLLYVGKFFVR